MFLGKIYRIFLIFRLTSDARRTCSSREKPGTPQDLLAMQSELHTTIEVPLKRLLSSRMMIGGGHVHVAFAVGDVCERLAV